MEALVLAGLAQEAAHTVAEVQKWVLGVAPLEALAGSGWLGTVGSAHCSRGAKVGSGCSTLEVLTGPSQAWGSWQHVLQQRCNGGFWVWHLWRHWLVPAGLVQDAAHTAAEVQKWVLGAALWKC